MNLADSMKSVLKNKSQHIFSDLIKDDLKNVLKDVAEDFSRMARSGKNSFRNMKDQGFKINVRDMIEYGSDTVVIFKVLPARVVDAFYYFKDDLQVELDSLEDQKHKNIFILKVFGALTTYTIGSIYNVKKGTADIKLKGLKRRNAFTQFIIAEIIFKISQLFIQRFLGEVEKLMSNPSEVENLKYFRQLLSDRSKFEEQSEQGLPLEPSDKAITIVENFKHFLITGKRLEKHS